MEPILKRLISLCELSAQTLYLHGRGDLVAQLPNGMLTPKYIHSKDANQVLQIADLDIKHMAFILRKSLFPETKKRDIRTSLA